MTDADKATQLLQALVGTYLSQLGVGVGQLQMRFSEGPSLSYGNDISVDDGVAVEAHSLDGLRLLLPLLNSEVTQVSADERGGLSLFFDATHVRCDADQENEAWNYSGRARAVVVSMPGGAFAIWS